MERHHTSIGMNIKDDKYYIWGTGDMASMASVLYMDELRAINFAGYIDNDSKKWGNSFLGKEIYSPEILKTKELKYIFIINKFEQEIRRQIETELQGFNCCILEDVELTRLKLIHRYENQSSPEIQEIVSYVKTHPLTPFNYSFAEKYKAEETDVNYDEKTGLYYTIYCGKKMYFSRDLNTEKKAKDYYNSILLEQDEESPHLYLTEQFSVPENAVVIDAGVAEGNFTLSIIDRVKKVYLFEPDASWIEALKYTFEPYKEKVIIVEKCLSDYISESVTTIDNEIKDEEINVIKMDIEGEEYYALKGALQTIQRSENMQCIICTYHKENVYDVIEGLLSKYLFDIEHSKGYMWFKEGAKFHRSTVLRRGLIRAKKGK